MEKDKAVKNQEFEKAAQLRDELKFKRQELEQMKMIQAKFFHDSDKTFDYTKLEVENNVDIPGEGNNG